MQSFLLPITARDAATLKQALEGAKPVRPEDAVATYALATASGSRSGPARLS